MMPITMEIVSPMIAFEALRKIWKGMNSLTIRVTPKTISKPSNPPMTHRMIASIKNSSRMM